MFEQTIFSRKLPLPNFEVEWTKKLMKVRFSDLDTQPLSAPRRSKDAHHKCASFLFTRVVLNRKTRTAKFENPRRKVKIDIMKGVFSRPCRAQISMKIRPPESV